MSEPLDNLIRALSRLPGLGRRSAERAALSLANNEGLLDMLSSALQVAKAEISFCRECGGLTTQSQNPCPICTDLRRNHRIMCVVESAGDIRAIETAGIYKGIYHSLQGKLSPTHGLSPDDLRITSLLERMSEFQTEEVIIALSTDLEGDATQTFLQEYIKKAMPEVKVTRLAYGLPVDSGIAFSDPVTLKRAIQGRF